MSNQMMKSALVVGTHTMGLGVIRALGREHVPVVALYYDKRDMGYGSKYVTERIFVPHPEHDEQEFFNLLLEIGPRFTGSFLVPVSDESLVSVSKNKSVLEKYYSVACADWDITQLILEKKHTYKLADKFGIPCPKTFIPRTLEEGLTFGDTLGYPCLVKPSQSHTYFALFGTKMVKAINHKELEFALRNAIEAKIEVLIQEYIPGDSSHTVNYNSYVWDSMPLLEFTAQQIRKAPPDTGSPCVVLSKNIPEVMEYGSKFLIAINFRGYSCSEFKLDPRDNVYKLIEVNGRHNLSTALAIYCGLNFPWLHYQHLILGESPVQNNFDSGKYWIDLSRDIFTAFRKPKLLRPLGKFFQPYLRSHTFAILDLRDLKPFLLRIVNFFRKN